MQKSAANTGKKKKKRKDLQQPLNYLLKTLKLLQKEFCAWLGFAEVKKHNLWHESLHLYCRRLLALQCSAATYYFLLNAGHGFSRFLSNSSFLLKCQKRPREEVLHTLHTHYMPATWTGKALKKCWCCGQRNCQVWTDKDLCVPMAKKH